MKTTVEVLVKMSTPETAIPAHILENIRCFLCTNYLSIFPIYISTDDETALCGRCNISNKSEYTRDVAYEDIAQFISFPCKNDKFGCEKQDTPENLKYHEIICSFHQLECLVNTRTKCKWTGTDLDDLLSHVKSVHDNDLLTVNRFEINLHEHAKERILFRQHDELFTLEVSFNAILDSFSCKIDHVHQNNNAKNFKYKLTLEYSNGKNTYQFAGKSTPSDSEHFTINFKSANINGKLNDLASVVVTVDIKKSTEYLTIFDGKYFVSLEESPKTPGPKTACIMNPNIDWDLLADLQCPLCLEYMISPIYQCLNGHSICLKCKSKIHHCQVCQGEINNTHNYTLEKLTTKLKYPCRYFKNGCSFTGPALEIEAHVNACNYYLYECPLKELEDCKSKTYKNDILKHVESSHRSFMVQNDKVNIKFNKDVNEDKYFLIKFSEEIFKLYYKYECEKFKWAVQIISKEENENYRFEIDVIDNSGYKLGHHIQGICISLAVKNVFENSRYFVCIDLDQIAHYITDTLSFKIKILKN